MRGSETAAGDLMCRMRDSSRVWSALGTFFVFMLSSFSTSFFVAFDVVFRRFRRRCFLSLSKSFFRRFRRHRYFVPFNVVVFSSLSKSSFFVPFNLVVLFVAFDVAVFSFFFRFFRLQSERIIGCVICEGVVDFDQHWWRMVIESLEVGVCVG